jgi:hypothetical protein
MRSREIIADVDARVLDLRGNYTVISEWNGCRTIFSAPTAEGVEALKAADRDRNRPITASAECDTPTVVGG